MSRALQVAWREFCSTVLTKGFLIGLLITPVLAAIGIGAMILMKNIKSPTVVGSVAVIDRSGLAADLVVKKFSAEAIQAEEKRDQKDAQKAVQRSAEAVGVDGAQAAQAQGMAGAQMTAHRVEADLTLEVLPKDADEEAAKAPLATANARGGRATADGQPTAKRDRIVVAVIPPGSLAPGADGTYENFGLYTAPKLDFEVQNRIERRIQDAIVDARLANAPAMKSAGVTAEQVRSLMRRPDANAKTITAGGERQSTGVGAMFVPAAFMMLLFMSVMVGAQGLLTSTIEEKSSRVMEVLLSAVSPMQLMLGKILGQMAAALLILLVYSGAGVAALLYFSLRHMLDPMNLVYLVVFFFLAYFLVASLLAAIGSAVTELREAQNLQTPVIMLIVLPWLMWMPVSRAPNSVFATVMSFIPGMGPFVMMIRLGGSEPIPAWQIPAAILVGILSAVVSVWVAAKIFRIGVLMYGKPPNFRTLIHWIRMA